MCQPFNGYKNKNWNVSVIFCIHTKSNSSEFSWYALPTTISTDCAVNYLSQRAKILQNLKTHFFQREDQ